MTTFDPRILNPIARPQIDSLPLIQSQRGSILPHSAASSFADRFTILFIQNLKKFYSKPNADFLGMIPVIGILIGWGRIELCWNQIQKPDPMVNWSKDRVFVELARAMFEILGIAVVFKAVESIFKSKEAPTTPDPMKYFRDRLSQPSPLDGMPLTWSLESNIVSPSVIDYSVRDKHIREVTLHIANLRPDQEQICAYEKRINEPPVYLEIGQEQLNEMYHQQQYFVRSGIIDACFMALISPIVFDFYKNFSEFFLCENRDREILQIVAMFQNVGKMICNKDLDRDTQQTLNFSAEALYLYLTKHMGISHAEAEKWAQATRRRNDPITMQDPQNPARVIHKSFESKILQTAVALSSLRWDEPFQLESLDLVNWVKLTTPNSDSQVPIGQNNHTGEPVLRSVNHFTDKMRKIGQFAVELKAFLVSIRDSPLNLNAHGMLSGINPTTRAREPEVIEGSFNRAFTDDLKNNLNCYFDFRLRIANFVKLERFQRQSNRRT